MKVAYNIFCMLLSLTFFWSCQKESETTEEMENNNKLNIRWIPSHDQESFEDGIISFKWAMSFLGAHLPVDQFGEAIDNVDQDIIRVDFRKLGFSDQALTELRKLVELIKDSEEYIEMGGVDLGRFIMLTLNSSNHYYAITDAKTSLEDFLESKKFNLEEVAIVQSGISFGNRIIQIPNKNEVAELAFISKEGPGKIEDGTFQVEEYEVVDIMSNGQSRFAIYDKNGQLLTSAKKDLSPSGKPSKCIWCHETVIQKNYTNSPPVPNYISPQNFNIMTESWNKGLDSLRSKLKTSLNFVDQWQHELMEITYISFMEPSAERLSMEWNLSLDEVKQRLSEYQAHLHPEFPFLGNLYNRNEIEMKAPFSSVAVPDDAREPSIFEPNYLNP